MSRLQTALEVQYTLALDRKSGGEESSYTCYLYRQGLNKILKKCGEETFEVAVAVKNGVFEDTVGEINDVLYHVTVLLCLCGVPFQSVMDDLNRRCRTSNANVDELMEIISARRSDLDDASYTAYLFREGTDKILKKVGEAISLLLISSKDGDKEVIATECGGLFYHLFALMRSIDLSSDDLADELERRGNKTGNLKQFHSSDHTT